MSDIVVAGAAVMDIIQEVDSFPRPGQTVTAKTSNIGFGGKGANQAVAAARLGAQVAMLTALSTDSYGDETLAHFHKENINTDYISRTSESNSAVAMIMVNATGENMICYYCGPTLLATPKLADDAEELFKSAKMAVVQLELPLPVTEATLKAARRNNLFTILDLAPAPASLPLHIYALADVCCPNETEAEVLLGVPVVDIETAETAAKELLARGCRYPVITLGEKGCVWVEKLSDDTTKCHHVSVPPVKAIDTTGAGDAFAGALAAFLVPHLAAFKTPQVGHCATEIFLAGLDFACLYASQSVQKQGTQYSYSQFAELPDELQNNWRSFNDKIKKSHPELY